MGERLKAALDQFGGRLVTYEDLVDRPAEVVHGVCAYLQIEPPGESAIAAIAEDVRRKSSSVLVREAILEDFARQEKVEELRSLYESFGYRRSPSIAQ
jgi:hypothetical protein